jgi:hypothetical protein
MQDEATNDEMKVVSMSFQSGLFDFSPSALQ